MLRLSFLVLISCAFFGPTSSWLVGEISAEEKQADKAVPAGRWTVEEMMKLRSLGDVQVSPSGRQVLYTVRTAIMTEDKSEYLRHLYLAHADGSGEYQFTHGDHSCFHPRWSPDQKWIAFLSGRSGTTNLWVIRAAGGEAWQLTHLESNISSFRWSPLGKQIAIVAAEPETESEKNSKKAQDDAHVIDKEFNMKRLWVVDFQEDSAAQPEPRKLTQGDFHLANQLYVSGYDWSPDGKTIAFTHTPTPLNNDWPRADISLVEVASGQVRSLVASGAAESSPIFSPDGKWIAYKVSDDPPSWGYHCQIHLISTTGKKTRLLATTHDQQPNLLGWAADGQSVLFTEERGTLVRISALPINGQPPTDLDRGKLQKTSVRLNRGSSAIGFVGQNSSQASEVYVSRIDYFFPVRISHANANSPQHPLGKTEIVHWKSKDGREIEGLLTYPVGYKPEEKYPLLLVIHGGPMGVFRQNHIASPSVYPLAAFAAKGYAILRCNVRGSSGYGKEFRYANYKDWGGMDFQDLMTGVDEMIERGIADPQRMGVMGWSYGGFLTSWTITQTNRFRAASVGAGVTNLMSFNGTTDIPGFIPDYFGVESWDDLETYRRHSPMFNIKGVTTPTLIQHGVQDRRVPISQGYELYNALKRQKVEVKMVTYPRTPHYPREPKLLLDAARRNLQWFEKHLGQVHGEE